MHRNGKSCIHSYHQSIYILVLDTITLYFRIYNCQENLNNADAAAYRQGAGILPHRACIFRRLQFRKTCAILNNVFLQLIAIE